MSEDGDRRRANADSILGTHSQPGSMVDKPAISQRTQAAMEDHAYQIHLLEEELDRRARIIIDLTRSLEFERDRAVTASNGGR